MAPSPEPREHSTKVSSITSNSIRGKKSWVPPASSDASPWTTFTVRLLLVGMGLMISWARKNGRDILGLRFGRVFSLIPLDCLIYTLAIMSLVVEEMAVWSVGGEELVAEAMDED
ncbi:hypothetical protein G7Y89_g14246 [Cudoniella acicularis]|uniref:Uncharacterized protein n=1 Tax=Cudoniella acicularis TaxID=354080 RepID=A0A8H4R4J3_9HELO|nr:hypothetical protein G7Y89_g14246 [Cudoniella acicularis]